MIAREMIIDKLSACSERTEILKKVLLRCCFCVITSFNVFDLAKKVWLFAGGGLFLKTPQPIAKELLEKCTRLKKKKKKKKKKNKKPRYMVL